ncbi:MAG: hypothetical protein KAH44_28345, partial [Oricola sp.]|nr:hypothetical protein [Oricola sp.]
LQEGGYLDPDGWPVSIPDGLGAIGTIWAWGAESQAGSTAALSRSGTYVLTYEGEGSIRVTLGAHVVSSEPGRIVFENPTGTQMGLEIVTTDPNGTGDYIRNVSVVPEQYEALAEAGQIFNPDWLAVVEDARQLRFMDWMGTNSSGLREWADRPKPEDASWATHGVPVEVMVELANQTGSDPWFTMPAMATDDYVRQFATYVRDHLDPELVAHVEYSNETWNWAFQQTRWLQEQADAQWGDGTNLDYLAKRATQVALIWDDVFAEDADTRIENVLGVQNGSHWWLNRILQGEIWAAHEPDAFVSPASVFDAVAVTTYFGSATVSSADLRAELLEVIRDPDVDAAAWLADRLMDPTYDQSIPMIARNWASINSVADQYGLDLIAYEGGQHVQHSFAVNGLTDADLTELNGFLIGFVRSLEMADLYADLWDAWAQISDGPFMQFGDVAAPSKWGSWGLLSALGDINPRAEFL